MISGCSTFWMTSLDCAVQLCSLESQVEETSSASSRSISLAIEVVNSWKDCVSYESSMSVLRIEGDPEDALLARLVRASTFFVKTLQLAYSLKLIIH